VPALLSASGVRIDVSGVPALDALSLTTTGQRVLVLGAARTLFEGAAGLRTITRGELHVDGATPIAGLRKGLIACAPLDPRLPPRWTMAQYIAWSALLVGHTRAAAKRLCADALSAMQLETMGGAKVGSATLSVRRGVVIAAALATGAPTILLDDPLAGLPEDTGRSMASVLSQALSSRRTIIFSGRIPIDASVAIGADEAVVVDGSRVTAQGTPVEVASQRRTLSLRVKGDVYAFARALDAEGAHATVSANAQEPTPMRVELGRLAPSDLLRIAAGVRTVVFELRPLPHRFA
jgi:ABC-type multidrug transport system ATPase subunit